MAFASILKAVCVRATELSKSPRSVVLIRQICMLVADDYREILVQLFFLEYFGFTTGLNFCQFQNDPSPKGGVLLSVD